jgi:hypothetical protein
MAESGLKEAIEGLDKLKFAVVLTLVLVVFIVVAFTVAIFVAVSARSAIPLAVAFLLLASFAYPLWLMARACGEFHKAFTWRDSYRWAQLLSMVMACLSVILSVVVSVWVATESVPPPNMLMRILGYFVGLGIVAVYARADMHLAEDTSTVLRVFCGCRNPLGSVQLHPRVIACHSVDRLSVVFRRSTGGPRGVA